MKTWVGLLALVVAVSVGAIWLFEEDVPEVAATTLPHAVSVNLPSLEGPAAAGAEVFAGNCAVCHGQNASGGVGGPPLIHRIYEPGHHGDASFVLAVRQGVRQHHWSFGNMPPVPGISDQQISQIVAYIRTLQRANGIH